MVSRGKKLIRLAQVNNRSYTWQRSFRKNFSQSTIQNQILKTLYLSIILDLFSRLIDLVPFVQFKKREKHPWRSVNTPPWVFFTFFKLYKWYQIAQRITYVQFESCTRGEVEILYDSLETNEIPSCCHVFILALSTFLH